MAGRAAEIDPSANSPNLIGVSYRSINDDDRLIKNPLNPHDQRH